jgi:hypothetical protein
MMTENDRKHEEKEIVNRVAAAMTAVAPSTDLRERVLARLEPRRPHRRWVYVLVPAMAAAAAVVLAVSLRSPADAIVESVKTAPAAASNAGATPTDPVADSTIAPVNASRTRSLTRPLATLPMTQARAAWHERAIPALTPIAPLEMAGIQPRAIDIAQLEVKPLTTPPIDGGTRQDEKER